MQLTSNQTALGRRSTRPVRDESSRARTMRTRARQEQLLDEALQETFPASDPVAVVRLT